MLSSFLVLKEAVCRLKLVMQDEVLPARRVAKTKSREVTPADLVDSDSDDTKALPSLTPMPTPTSTPPGKKAKLKKKLPEQQPDVGSARKRRKRLSQTPEPSSSTALPLDGEEAQLDGDSSQQEKQRSVASASGQNQKRASMQEDTGQTKPSSKPVKAVSRSPASKGQKKVKSHDRSASQTPAGVHFCH